MKVGKHPHISRIYRGMNFGDAADMISQKYKDRGKDRISKRTFNFEMEELARLNDAKRVQGRRDIMGATGAAMDEHYQNLELGFGGYTDPNLPDKIKSQDVKDSRADRVELVGTDLKIIPTRHWKTDTISGGQSGPRRGLALVNAGGGELGRKIYQNGGFGEPGVPPSENIYWQSQQTRPLEPMAELQPLPTRAQGLEADLANIPATPVETESYKSRNWLKGIDKEKGFGNIYGPGLVGTVANLGINAAMLLRGYDKTAPKYNPYEQDVLRQMQERGADYTALENKALAGYNVAQASAGESRSAALRNALVQNASSNLSQNLSQIKLQEQQYNDQIKAQLATTMNQLGTQRAQADTIAEELNQRAKSNFQSQASQFGAQLAQTGKFFTRLRANKQMNDMYSNILSSKYADFGVNKDLYNKVVRGEDLSEAELFTLKNTPEAEDLLKFNQWAQKNK